MCLHFEKTGRYALWDSPEHCCQPQAHVAALARVGWCAFNFMDSNHDGKVSREEASGFSGVAKHFDQADTDHDNFLSREEFDKAMNYVKAQ